MSGNTFSQDNEATIGIDSNITAKVTRYSNVDQTFITITEDKMKLILIENLKKIEDKKSWLTPIGIFLALLLVPLTTEKFKDFLSIPAAVWQAGCYIAIAIFFIMTVISIFKVWKNKEISIDSIINELKQNETINN